MQELIKQAQDAFLELSGNASLTQDEMLSELNQRIADKIQPQLPEGSSFEVTSFVVDQPLIEPYKWACKFEVSFPLATRVEEPTV